jgi:hypothetical protein
MNGLQALLQKRSINQKRNFKVRALKKSRQWRIIAAENASLFRPGTGG